MDQRKIDGLELFKSLTKDGCEWQGDVFSRKWSECLYAISPFAKEKAKRTLEAYKEGIDYQLEGSFESNDNAVAIWIA
jgi:hypothetical protein